VYAGGSIGQTDLVSELQSTELGRWVGTLSREPDYEAEDRTIRLTRLVGPPRQCDRKISTTPERVGNEVSLHAAGIARAYRIVSRVREHVGLAALRILGKKSPQSRIVVPRIRFNN
jgi:hypothetical protein